MPRANLSPYFNIVPQNASMGPSHWFPWTSHLDWYFLNHRRLLHSGVIAHIVITAEARRIAHLRPWVLRGGSVDKNLHLLILRTWVQSLEPIWWKEKEPTPISYALSSTHLLWPVHPTHIDTINKCNFFKVWKKITILKIRLA